MRWSERLAQCKEWKQYEAGTHVPCPVVVLFAAELPPGRLVEPVAAMGGHNYCNQCGAPAGTPHRAIQVRSS